MAANPGSPCEFGLELGAAKCWSQGLPSPGGGVNARPNVLSSIGVGGVLDSEDVRDSNAINKLLRKLVSDAFS